MRLVFAGTPEPAVPSLRRLAASAHDIVAVVTRHDAPVGRKRVLTPSPVAAAAEELGLPVIRADRLDAEATARIAALREAVPTLEGDAILGPVPVETGVRALVRFEYGSGSAVTESLRASLVAAALRARRGPKSRPDNARPKLRVRVDVPDLDL